MGIRLRARLALFHEGQAVEVRVAEPGSVADAAEGGAQRIDQAQGQEAPEQALAHRTRPRRRIPGAQHQGAQHQQGKEQEADDEAPAAAQGLGVKEGRQADRHEEAEAHGVGQEAHPARGAAWP